MYKLTYDDIRFEWKDEALSRHGDVRQKMLYQSGNRRGWTERRVSHATLIKNSVWDTIKKFGFPKDCLTEKDKKIYLLNLMDTKLTYKEIIDWTIAYLNEAIKY